MSKRLLDGIMKIDIDVFPRYKIFTNHYFVHKQGRDKIYTVINRNKHIARKKYWRVL